MKKVILYIIGIVATCSFASCSSDFLKEYSQSLARVQNVDDLNELLVGDCNLPLGLFDKDDRAVNLNYMMLHFMGDELQENYDVDFDPDAYTGQRDEMFPYFTWQQNTYLDVKGRSSYESAEDVYWSLAYQKIGNCNMVIDAADNLSVSTDEERKRVTEIKGEASFLRAFYYLTLVNLYGKPYAPATASTELAVPVKTSSNVENREFERATVADVYAQIVSDLTVAEQNLHDVSVPSSIYHVGIEAVYILRSRVALYMQDWQTAETYAQKAIDKNGYLLSLASVGKDQYPISKSNQEVVYSNGASCLGNVLFYRPKGTYYGAPYPPTWYISDDVYGLYEDNDYRKETYITTDDDLNAHLPTYHKIDNREAHWGIYNEVSDVFSIRTAEAYLNMAEAKAELGKDAEACSLLDHLRKYRMEAPEEISLSGAELVNFVRDERERELCLEGHRWFDLRRYSVDEKFPFAKEIVHTMTTFKNVNYEDVPSVVNMYRLEKNDAAYVLDIPKQERDFQPSLGRNIRPARNPFETKDVLGDVGGDDDYDY